ncbi:1,4-dihydroxy-2-naphthoyl-CoA hydrolase [Microbulbifer sp. NBRC 101763]|uniref:acyl-CoA thioesterase n=1 Tax=Microbulbifer TaxID=48073 RepID=UPI00039FE17C|nr:MULTISPECIES: thioesterase family protein [Microbulbifer]WHI49223.1 thioesterase family protein [Microbulbifer sp. MLAF003]
MITVKRKVLFGDCDPAGIVYTPRFSDFALEATHEAMSVLFDGPAIRRMKQLGFITPVRAFNLEFLTPVTWDQELKIQVSISDIGNHSFSFQLEAYLESGAPAFTANITYVTLSASDRVKIPLPGHLRDTLAQANQANAP